MRNKKWLTRETDMQIAGLIIEEYASDEGNTLGLFELVVNEREKKMNFRIAHWVRMLTEQFTFMYGENQGDYVTRRVLSDCLRHGSTIH